MGLFSNLVFCLVFFSKNLKKKLSSKKRTEEGVLILKSNAKHYTTLSNKRFYSFFLPIAQTQRAF